MTAFEKLVDQVGDEVFNTVGEYVKEVMGSTSDWVDMDDIQKTVFERVLVELMQKYRPENVIIVEED